MSPIDSSQINLDLTLNSLKKKNDLFASFDKLATSSESPSPTNSDWYNIENPKEDILSKNFAKQIYHTSNSYQISECFDKNNPFLESESSSSSSEDDREKLSINSEESRLKPIIECENEHDDLENSNRRSTKKLPIMVEKIREHQLQQRYDKQGDLNSKSRIEEPFPVDYLANADPVIVISTDDGPGRLSRGNSMRIKGGSIRRNISTRQHKNVSLAGTQERCPIMSIKRLLVKPIFISNMGGCGLSASIYDHFPSANPCFMNIAKGTSFQYLTMASCSSAAASPCKNCNSLKRSFWNKPTTLLANW
uniref:Uncharacterized protein n=1 Tax=Romanomermis culicivorax TaxID=13658 RepID=A0A915KKX1_ROMCU